jgi:glutamyl-tRNA synthetase
MPVAQMIELFDTDGLQKKAAVFDTKKLEWMNGQHLSLLPLEELVPRVIPVLEKAGLATAADVAARREWFHQLLDLLRVRARTTDDIVRQAAPYLRDDIEYDPEAVAKQLRKDPAATAALLAETHEALASLASWEPAAMEESLRQLAERRGVQAGKIFQPLRVALTGLGVSPGIFDVLGMIGRERSLARILKARDLATGT